MGLSGLIWCLYWCFYRILVFVFYSFLTVNALEREERMGLPDALGDLSSEVDVDAFRRLFPLRFYERHLTESIRLDGRPL